MPDTSTVHRLTIERWHPAKVNQLLGHWAQANRRKASDREMVHCYAIAQQIPKAMGRRRVSLVITLAGPGRPPDADGFFKSTLDALTACGMLIDDSPKWCELGPVTFERGPERQTIIELTDLEERE